MKESVRIQIKYLAALRDLTRRMQEEVVFPSGSTLGDVAQWLSERYVVSVPSPQVMATLNGQGWRQFPSQLSTEVHDGDVIYLLPPIAGG